MYMLFGVGTTLYTCLCDYKPSASAQKCKNSLTVLLSVLENDFMQAWNYLIFFHFHSQISL